MNSKNSNSSLQKYKCSSFITMILQNWRPTWTREEKGIPKQMVVKISEPLVHVYSSWLTQMTKNYLN